jgi:acyl-coenzyme A synthetase/AMP-(fatty) acid ligase
MFEQFPSRRFDGRRQPAALVDAWRRAGLYREAVIGPSLLAKLGQGRERTAVVDGEMRITNGDLLDASARLAGAFTQAGVRPGEVVSWQVPNWWEAVVIALATWRVGAVNNPILTIYREHELRQILTDLTPAVVIAPERFRRIAHLELIDTVLGEIGHEPRLRIGVRGSAPGWRALSDLIDTHAPRRDVAIVSPQDPCIIAYTSGTTAGAKGVVLDSCALLSETEQMRGTWGLAWDDATFMPAPLAHLTGVTVGITVPLSAGATAVLMDVWEPDLAVPMIERERCCLSAGTPTFLEEIVSRYEQAGTRSCLRQQSVGGQAVAPRLIERSHAVGIHAFRLYGMTEHLTTTIANGSASLETRSTSDGPIAPGNEVSCVDPEGRVLPRGEVGEIRVRGPERMLGYVDPAHEEDVLDHVEGWFSTGDIGRVDEHGNVHVEGRIKDIINRGGEKFSAREMEDVICRHPSIRQAAVVPAPDDRLGEVPMAFIVLAAGDEPPSAAMLATFVQGQGLAKQKTPVSWIAVDALPATPFGKVKKQELVAMLAGSETVA